MDSKDAELQEVRNKFGRFKELCLKIDQSNEWIIYFKDITLELFLYTIQNSLKEHPEFTIDEFYMDIIKNAELDDEKVGTEVKKTVKLYIEYFIKITKTHYNIC